MSGLGWHHLTTGDKSRILAALEGGEAGGGPYHVELHPTNRCNNRCFFCSTRLLRRDEELPLERVREIIAEMRRLGTRSVGLNGGGEPLFHPQMPIVLELLRQARLPIANLTTNGVFLDRDIARALLQGDCDQVVVSLNAADEGEYARMMGVPPATFHQVLANVRGLVRARKEARSRRPRILLHFPVYKGNFRTLPGMYDLARSLEVDRIIFSGLGFLEAHEKMTPAETEEMMGLYEHLVRRDEYRWIDCIYSMEQDLSALVGQLNARLGSERNGRPKWRRLVDLAWREGTWRQKWEHHWRARRRRRALHRSGWYGDSCLMPWYALVVKGNGAVPVCCVLQGHELNDIHAQTLGEIWQGERFQRVRRQMRGILEAGEAWQWDAQADADIASLCGVRGGSGCFMRSFYYWTDRRFLQRLQGSLRRIHGGNGC